MHEVDAGVSDSEQEDWHALLLHPGWHRLVAHMKTQWGAKGYKGRISSAIASAERTKSDVGAAVRIVDAISDEVTILMNYPGERLAALQKAQETTQAEPTMLTEMSRRGGL